MGISRYKYNSIGVEEKFDKDNISSDNNNKITTDDLKKVDK